MKFKKLLIESVIDDLDLSKLDKGILKFFNVIKVMFKFFNVIKIIYFF